MFAKNKNEERDTSKALRQFSRQELLQLLLDQMQEAEGQEKELIILKESYERLKDKLGEKDTEIEAIQERMKSKLNDKDEQIAQLQQRMKIRLDAKDEEIERYKKKLDYKDEIISSMQAEAVRLRAQKEIIAQEPGNIAEAAIKINEVFEAAQNAAAQYLESIRMKYEGNEFISADSEQAVSEE